MEKFAVPHQDYQTNANNFTRKIKLKNALKANLTFDIEVHTRDTKAEAFRLLDARTNSPAALAANSQKSFCLTYDSILEATVELTANPSNLNEWPME